MTLATPPFGKILGVMSGLFMGTLTPNLKSVALIVFEILAFNAEIYRGLRDSGHAPFWKNFGVVSGLSLEALLSNFKSVALSVFELLAFNAQKFRGSRDPSYVPFWTNFWGHVRTVPGKTCVKFEVRSFIRF